MLIYILSDLNLTTKMENMKKTIGNIKAKYTGSKFYSTDLQGAVNYLNQLVNLQ